MKKHFYEKTSFIVFAIIAIIVMIGSLILNNLGYMSTEMLRIIAGPLGLLFIGTFIYMIHCAIKDKKLRNKNQSGEPKVIIELTTGPFKKPGDAIIDIDGFKYFIESPFRKEGTTPKTSDTFYFYLSSLYLLEPIARKMIKWLKKDKELSDTLVTENYLCYYFRDLCVADSNNPLFLFYTYNEKMNLIIAIEQLRVNKTPRGLEHITALINAASDHERKNYAGGGLLDAFDLFKNGLMTPKIFRKGNSMGYCFLYKN